MCELMLIQGENFFFFAQRADRSKTDLFENSEYVIKLYYMSYLVSFSVSFGLVNLQQNALTGFSFQVKLK